jgi:hypothetical protein
VAEEDIGTAGWPWRDAGGGRDFFERAGTTNWDTDRFIRAIRHVDRESVFLLNVRITDEEATCGVRSFTVPDGEPYAVTIRRTASICSCPDYTHRGTDWNAISQCQHIIYVKLRLFLLAPGSTYAAEQSSLRCCQMVSKTTYTPDEWENMLAPRRNVIVPVGPPPAVITNINCVVCLERLDNGDGIAPPCRRCRQACLHVPCRAQAVEYAHRCPLCRYTRGW